MEAVKGMDERSCILMKPCSPSKLKLAPLTEGAGPVGLLREEVDALTTENSQLVRKVAELERKYCESCAEAEKLKEALGVATRSVEQAQAARAQPLPPPQLESEYLNQLEAELGQLRSLSMDLERSVSAREQLEQHLSASRQQAAEVRAQLTLAKQELERKFSETAAYANMKKMLLKKNELIKELRGKLQALDPTADTSDDTAM